MIGLEVRELRLTALAYPLDKFREMETRETWEL